MYTPKLAPISRNNLFYSADDFNLENDIVQGYIEEDLNQCVVLYEVDRKRTNADSIYKESSNIRFKPPREIPCMYEIERPSTKSYDNKSSNGVYMQSGDLKCYVLTHILESYKCDIKRGDYLGVQVDVERMYYFVVTDDGKVNNANATHIGAYKTAWREIKASPTTLEEFGGK